MLTHRTAVLLVATGSPEAPTPEAVRAHLKRFLSDRRVVDLPRWQWLPILNLFILPNRPKKSAPRYAEIWTEEGSPFTVETERQVAALRANLARAGRGDVEVAYCCLYSAPEIDDVLHELIEVKGCDRLVVVPFYPQYASVTNGTLGANVFTALTKHVRIPSVDFIDSFSDDPDYLDALAASVRRSSWTYQNDGRHALVFTFHSTLVKDIEAGDVYRDQVERTAAAVARRLAIPEGSYHVGYQSVFDKRPWLGPLTKDDLIPRLVQEGVTDLAVVAPGFVCECLETHFDVNVDQRRVFEELAPEGRFTYVPCLGCDRAFVDALTKVVLQHLV